MKALLLKEPGVAVVEEIALRRGRAHEVLLRVRMVRMCGSNLNTFRGTNPMFSYPRVLGHVIAAAVLESGGSLYEVDTNVTVSPSTSCGACFSCRRNRPNACVKNQTLGVQRDGTPTEMVAVPANAIYREKLALKALRLVEPLTVGTHAASRGGVTD